MNGYKRKFTKPLAGFFLVLFMTHPLWAAPAQKGPRKVATVFGITEYRLPNGLMVLLVPDQTSSTVTVNMTYFVGSRHEGYGETGMAHLLEHMLFRRTQKYPLVWQVLSDRGAQFNGTTWVDRTNYFETLPATDENLRFALDIEKERMVNAQIESEDLEKEMSVVRNEFEMGENYPLNILSQRVLSTAFLWHNYGKSTIGSREDIERVSAERLRAFYQKYYRPENAMLVVAGRLNTAHVLADIMEIYGEVPRAERPLDPTYTVEPTQDGPREVILRRVGDIQGISTIYHIGSATHPDMAPLEVLAHILSATETGRLYQALVKSDLATRVWAYGVRLREPGFLEIGAEVRTEKSIVKANEVMQEVLGNLGNITAKEVNRAKAQFAKDFHLLLNDSRRVGIALTEPAAAGDWRLMFYHRDRLARVKPADVKRVAKEYLKESNRTTGLFIPTSSPDRTTIEPAPPVEKLLTGYAGPKAYAPGEEFEPTPQNIEARVSRRTTDFGMRMALLPKKTRGQNVYATFVFHYGTESDFVGKVEVDKFLPPMLMRGTERMSRREIEDFLNEQMASVSIGDGGLGDVVVTVQTVRPNLRKVLTAVGEFLQRPAFPEEELNLLRKESLAYLEQQRSDPSALGRLEMERRLRPYDVKDVRYVPTLEERMKEIERMQVADLREMHRQLWGASYSEMAIVGDFDPREVVAEVQKVFAGWRNPRPYRRVEMPFVQARPGQLVIETPDKANAYFSFGFNLALREDDPEYEPLFMANYVLGGRPNSRLILRIRHQDGLSYGVGSSIQASPHEPFGRFSVGGICAPQNAAKAIEAAREEMSGLLARGPSAEELREAQQAYAESLKISLSHDASLANTLARDLYLGRKMDFVQKRLEKIMALTPEEITRSGRKFLYEKPQVVVKAGDFKNSPPGYSHPHPIH